MADVGVYVWRAEEWGSEAVARCWSAFSWGLWAHIYWFCSLSVCTLDGFIGCWGAFTQPQVLVWVPVRGFHFSG